ncbi:M6 family metalloprotease domain-containing protein [Corallococcus exiguus]|uniref:M6 family metalloprotease domain-containing protein n=1 Tax=Corallococcus exiguus TaxID=83462 RepID=UPI001A8E0222|nr:M6 family metalloprotease domain-containing protein [Corallococcus exiguus]MBN8468372.1 M6 family metalloprotease domain-containing protein [Corallococcus exiguus]
MSAIFGEVLTLGQAKGPDVPLKVVGDEHYARYETLSGYTVLHDAELGLFCYARLVAGALRSTGIPLTQAAPAGLQRHIQESFDVRELKATARRLRRSASTGGRLEAEVVRTFGPNQGLLAGRVLASGPVKGLTILVNFQDVTTTVTRADVEEMLNGANYTRNGNICSAREYFRRVSSGKLDYTNVVVGPYTLSRNRQFYVNNLLIEEALQLAVAAGLDLKQFDSRDEDIIDALNVLYAGPTQYIESLWPHNSSIDLQFGSMRTDLYLLTSLGRTPAELSIGTFCHENGHLLCRFPDMYDYGKRDGDTVVSAGIGSYCLMGSGNHLDFGRSPSPVCGYLRDLVGWCDNEVDLSTAGQHQARHGDYNTVMKYRTTKPNEYFIVENRSKMGLDRALPASGLAVYHCDILGSNELQQGTAAQHFQCALLQADGHRHLELGTNTGDGADLFGETQGVALSGDSVPHSREWDGRDSGLSISDVGSPGEHISLTVGQAVTPQIVTGQAQPMMAIPDDAVTGVSVPIRIAASGTVSRVKVGIDVQHPFIGDLNVVLTSPTGRREVLHAQLGGPADNLVATYDSASPGMLTNLLGQPMKGDWILNVSDRARDDVGTLRSWRIELWSEPVAVARPQ